MPSRRLGIITFLLGLALFGVYFWAPYWLIGGTVQAASLKELFINRLEEQFPIRVSCASLQFRGGKIELKDLQVKTLDKQPLLKVPVTRAGIDLWNLLLHPTSMKNALTRLDMINPTVYLSRDTHGHWNVERLTHMPKKEGMDLKIGIENGRLELPNEIAGWKPGSLFGINGELNLAKNRQIGWKLVGRTTQDKQTIVMTEGTVTPSKSNGQILLKADNLPLALIQEGKSVKEKMASWGISDISGQCNAELRLRQTGKGWTWETASCQLENAGGRWNKLGSPVSGLEGQMRIFPEFIQVDSVKGHVGSAVLRLDGETDLTAADSKRELNVLLNGFDLAVLKPALPSLASWNLQGRADLRLRLSGSLKVPRLRGEVHVSEGSGQFPKYGWHLSGLESLIVLADDGIQLRYLKGSFEDSQVEAEGRLKDWKAFQWDVRATVSHFGPNRFWPKLPLRVGELQGEAVISGPLAQPVFRWKTGTDRLIWNQLDGHDLKAEGSYELKNGLLTIDNFRLGLGKAWIEGQGSGETRGDDPKFTCNIRGSSVNLADLPSLMSPDTWAAKITPLAGVVSFNVSGNGRIKNWRTWELQGDLQGTEGEIPVARFQQLASRFQLHSGKIRIDQFSLIQAGGKLLAQGEWSPESGVSGEFEAENLWINTVIPGEKSRRVEGSLSGRIDLSGSQKIDSYAGGGRIDLTRIAIDGEALGDLRLDTKLENSTFHLDGSSLQLDKGGSVIINGSLAVDGPTPQMDMQIKSDDLTLAAISKWIPLKMPVVMAGAIRTELRMNGPINQLDIEGIINSETAEISGCKLGATEIRLAWKEGKLRIDGATVRQGDGYLNVKGYLSADDVDMAVQAVQFPLNGLAFTLGGVPIQGVLNLNGRIRGSIQHLDAKGDLSVDSLNLGGIEFRHVEGGVAWKDRTLSMAHLTAEQGSQHLIIDGNVAFEETPRVDLVLKMEEIHIRELMLVVGYRPRFPMDGVISGDLKLQGPLSEPHMRLTASLQNGYVQGYSQLTGGMDLEIIGKDIDIHHLELKGPDGSLTAEGYYQPGKQGALRLNVDNFDLQPAIKPFSAKETIEGRLDLQANIEYGDRGMQGKISGRIRNGKWRQILLPITELKGDIQDNLLSLNLEQKDIGLILRGEGPVDPRWLSWLQLPPYQANLNAPIHWELSAPQITGEMAKSIFPQVESASGTVGLNLTVQGTWQSPQATGEINIKHLNGKITILPEAFADINGRVRINGNKLEIISLSSKYGKGKASVSGGTSLRGIIPDQLNLNIQIKRFHYSNPSFDGIINSEFTLGGTIHDPVVSGDAVIDRSRIQITRGKRRNYFNPRLDVNLKLGKDNYFHQPGLTNLLITGELKATGTLVATQLKGTVNTTHGTVTIYGTTFRVVEASANFSPEEGVFPYLSGQAVTRTKDAEIRVFINGWTSKIVDIRFESTPQKSYEEILEMLHWTDLGGGGLSLLQGNMYSVMDSVLGSTLDQFRDTLRMDFFDLEQEPLAGPLRLNIGKSITNNLFVTYSRALDPTGQDTWLVEYSLTPTVSLMGEYSEDDGTQYQIDFHFRF